jgi:hypothetical protein
MIDVAESLRHKFENVDGLWRKRCRKITTASIFSALSDAAVRKRGIAHVLGEDCQFTPQALGRARAKLPPHVFADVNASHRPTPGPRTYAVDGSKVHVHPCYEQEGCTNRHHLP